MQHEKSSASCRGTITPSIGKLLISLAWMRYHHLQEENGVQSQWKPGPGGAYRPCKTRLSTLSFGTSGASQLELSTKTSVHDVQK